jgi:2-polyprenyl-3-methyl-5-hydroxy-6-metoxy-1,4-benzoquinol methylase
MMSEKLRTYGIDNPDHYWQERRNDDRIKEYHLHRFIRDLVDRYFPERGAKVLDCGMGAGHVLKLCRENHQVYGIDYSAEAIEIYSHPEDDVRQADLNEGIPDFGTPMDAIVASMVLHWLDSPEQFMRALHSRLSERGIAIIVVPNIVVWKFRVRYFFAGKFPAISLSHKNFQTPCEVEQVFDQAGFRVEKVLSCKKKIRTRLFPRLFSNDLIYVLKPL